MSLPEWLAGISFLSLSLCVAIFSADNGTTLLFEDQNQRICTTSIYLSRLKALKCNGSYSQKLVDIYAECGYNDVALREVNDCGILNGKFCYELSEPMHQYRDDVNAMCFDEYGKPICSLSCQQALRTFKERVGCCINNLYNASKEPYLNDRSASNILWTACGVTPVSGFCKSTLAYREIHQTRVCVKEEVEYRKSLLECSHGYGQSLADLFRKCGYSKLLRYVVNLCGVNADERYCFEFVNDGTADSAASDVMENCVGATEMGCSLACQVALDDYRRQLGCCINNLYGHEASNYFGTTSPALWRACNVHNSGICRTTISMTGAALLPISAITTILLCIFFLLLIL